MTMHIALLRAVNLGGLNRVGMAELRAMLEGLGWQRCFSKRRPHDSQLEGLFERAAKKQLGIETDFIVRTTRELKDVIAGNPFPQEAERAPSHPSSSF
jgi:uncharacterized protein (DUF1697 family)